MRFSRTQAEGLLMLALAAVCFWLPQHLKRPLEADGRILVASGMLEGTPFAQSVILILRHNGFGAEGLVLNKPSSDVGAPSWGGPVAEGNYITLHSDDVSAPGSEKIESLNMDYTEGEPFARSLGHGRAVPSEFIVFKGISDWGQGQLSREIAAGAWRVIPFDRALVFHTKPVEMWAKAGAR
jgi:putative transcriptional regulator